MTKPSQVILIGVAGVLVGIVGYRLFAYGLAGSVDEEGASVLQPNEASPHYHNGQLHSPTKSESDSDDGNDKSTESSVSEREFTIEFENGEVFSFSRRDYPKAKVRVTSVSEDYDKLYSLAESGNGEAALYLGTGLQRCMDYGYGTEEELNQAISKLHETNAVVNRSGELIASVLDGDLESAESGIRRQYQGCKGIDEAAFAESRDWIRTGAEAGHPMAIFEYANSFPEDPNTVTYLESLWGRGYSATLEYLAVQYADTDRVRSYAYNYLYAKIVLHTPVKQREWMKIVEEELVNQGLTLSPRELDQAMEIAISELNKIENCCVF